MSIMLKSEMHGLNLFISDIRNCKSKEAEIKRINKELANIRSKFGSGKILEGRKKKKYICKLIYIFLLGHNFDFGDMEAVNLLSSGKYSEKFMGYLFISIVLNEKSNLMRLITKCLENDLTSHNPHHQDLALKYIANMANRDIAETLGKVILHLLLSDDAVLNIKQSALLCLLTLFRIKPDIIPKEDYPERIVSFLTDNHLGVVTSAISLIEELAKAGRLDGTNCMSIAICKLNRLIRSPCMDMQDYNYYLVCAPWLSVKLLKLLQCFDFPSEPILGSRLMESLELIFNKVQEPPKTKKMGHRISKHSLMFEAVKLIHHMKMIPSSIRIRACNILDMCLKQRESNLRYSSLEGMKILSECDVSRQRIKCQLKPIIDTLSSETDMCVRQKAADLLCVLCDKNNYKKIISEMLAYLETGNTSIRKETILKISLLSEKYFDDPKWYVDTILRVIYFGGEYVTEKVWYRFIHVVANNSNAHGYAAKRVFETLQSSKCNENLITLTAYILGEFGNLIAGDSRSSPFVQLNLLHSKFHISSLHTRALLLTTYVKFANLFPEIKDEVKTICKINSNSPYTEIQQRAVEYLNLCNIASADHLATIFDEMPCFKQGTSAIENALQELKFKSSEEYQNKEPLQRTTTLSGHTFFSETYSTLKDESIKEAVIERSLTLPQINEPQSDFDILVDVFNKSKYPSDNPICRSMSASFLSSAGEALIELLWLNSGILFDSNILRVYTESQFHEREGRIRFKYYNKTPQAFISFLVHFPFENNLHKWTFFVGPCSTTIHPNTEIEQEIKVECLQDFSYMPSLSLSFLWAGTHQAIPIQIPMSLNKFIKPVIMNSEDFLSKWNSTILQQMEVIKTFPAKYIIDKNLLEKKLGGFGVSVLENIDPDPENYVCSGIFHSRLSKVGVLVRLQPHHQTYSYQLTVRAAKKQVAEEVSRLLEIII